jgi:hypothetical protein
MTWTTLLENLALSHTWQIGPESEAESYRLSVVSADFGLSGIGRVEVAQFDADGSGYGTRYYRPETWGLIIQCRKPFLFQSQRVGFRIPIGFNPFVLKVEVNDMPLSNPPEGAPASDSVTSTTVPSTTTAALLVAANPLRKDLSIQNASTANLFIDFDGIVTTASYLTKIAPGGYYEVPMNYRGAVHGIWDKVNGAADIREYV